MIEQYKKLHQQLQSRATYLLNILNESGEDCRSIGINAWTCLCVGDPVIEPFHDYVEFRYDISIPYEPEDMFEYFCVPYEFLQDTLPTTDEVLEYYLGEIEKDEKQDYIKRVANALQLLDTVEGEDTKKMSEYMEIAEKVVEANWGNLK